MRDFNPAAIAASWKRPYTSVQWAWIKALGIKPSDSWSDGRNIARRGQPKRREMREAMRQRYGVRGL